MGKEPDNWWPARRLRTIVVTMHDVREAGRVTLFGAIHDMES